MVLGIDASNIKAGGGMTHLKELIEHFVIDREKIEKIIIWGGNQLDQIEDFDWLEKRKPTELIKGGLFWESKWKIFSRTLEFKNSCDILFVPGGVYSNNSVPYVSMSQNMLVFEKEESSRFGYSWNRIRFFVLNYLQKRSFQNARGVIFISHYAKNYITSKLKKNPLSTIVNHGVAPRFEKPVKRQYPIEKYSIERPFKILYISIINVYKHQCKVAIAVSELRNEGFPIEVNFVGGAYKPYLKKVLETIDKYDKDRKFLKYHGFIPYSEIDTFYHSNDIFLFASTCENMPNIIIEAMHSGLPLLVSNKEPMPEFVKDSGFYFDALSVESIKDSIKEALLNPEKRLNRSIKAKQYAKDYSWDRCSHETLEFLEKVQTGINK